MKNMKLLTLMGLLIGITFTNCDTSSQKVVDTKNRAEKDLKQAKKEHLEEVRKTKTAFLDVLIRHDQEIMAFKEKIATEKQEVKDKYTGKIAELEEQNQKIKDKLEHYQIEGESQWKAFKRDINHDINMLEDAINQLTINGVSLNRIEKIFRDGHMNNE